MSFAQIVLEGFISKDAEMKYLPSGVAVANTSIPVTKKWKDDNGQQHEKTVWYKLNVWGKSAEAFHKWAKKGTGMLIVGEPEEPGKWVKDGQPYAQNEVRVNTWTFSSAKKGDGNGSSGPEHHNIENMDDLEKIEF